MGRFARLRHDTSTCSVAQVGNRLGRLGTNLLAGSKELFEQVAEAVQNELDGIEGHISKPRKSTTQSRASR